MADTSQRRRFLQCPRCGAENLPLNKFCGQCGANLRGETQGAMMSGSLPPKVGTVLPYSPGVQGPGRVAVLAVIALCFRLGFQRIEAMSDARNARALHFADSLGMAREGLLRHHERDPQGEFCDMVLYAALNLGSTTEGRP